MEEIIEKDPRPKVVAKTNLAGVNYTTVNFGIKESEERYSCHSATFVDIRNFDTVFERIKTMEGFAQMTREELVEIGSFFNAKDITIALRELMLAKIISYDKSGEVNRFIFNGNVAWFSKDERVGLANACEMRRKENLDTISIVIGKSLNTMPIEHALDMLAKLEVYASDCFLSTARKKLEVEKMNSQELLKYSVSEGYPSPLEFTF